MVFYIKCLFDCIFFSAVKKINELLNTYIKYLLNLHMCKTKEQTFRKLKAVFVQQYSAKCWGWCDTNNKSHSFSTCKAHKKSKVI